MKYKGFDVVQDATSLHVMISKGALHVHIPVETRLNRKELCECVEEFVKTCGGVLCDLKKGGIEPPDVKRKADALKEYAPMFYRVQTLEQELTETDDPVLKELFDREKKELNEKLESIEVAICVLPDVDERNVLWSTYIGNIKRGVRRRCERWQIANSFNYSEAWVKKKHDSGIKHIKL